ncbi:MAG: ABC transporter substrate-binding protein [Candidatus Limnocylindrales bacterium]
MSRRLVVLALFVAVAAGACGTSGSSSIPAASGSAVPSASASPSTAAGSPAAPSATAAPVKLVVGLGYIPSVQFAPFYLADQAGYYTDAGLSVEFQNKIDPDLITLVGQGAIDVGIGDGTSVIPAASQGIPVKYIATIYGQFPDIVFAKASSGITTAADLKGKKIGTPGRYGGGWIMLQALLGSAGLTVSDVDIVEYPDFTQRAAVEQGAVDAATGFSNNEPVQLELDGSKAVVLHIDAITPLPGPGLIASAKTLTDKRDAITRFVAATLRAMNALKLNPSVGLDAAIKAVPELGSARDPQMAILKATIESWTGPVQAASGLGAIDRDGWTKSIAYLTTLGLVPTPVTVDDLVEDGFIPVGG